VKLATDTGASLSNNSMVKSPKLVSKRIMEVPSCVGERPA
jgi:hypothetical protein